MMSKRVIELKALLDSLVREAEYEDEPPPEARAVLDQAITNFRRSGPEILDEATEYMWSYYRDVASEFSIEQRRVYGIPEIEPSADLWTEVEFQVPPFVTLGGSKLEPDRSYVSFEGEVSWEPEHGLQLVFAEGLRVCKVGPYDGHHTHAHAYGDESLLGVVYK